VSASSIPGPTLNAPVPPDEDIEQESSSKAWIAGAVVGPVLGLALVGAGIWLFLRRRKKAVQPPQHGSASMAPVDPHQPPTGVGGCTYAKPRFHPAQPTYYERPGQPGAYAQQRDPQQVGFSPAPQHGFQSAHNATAWHPHEAKYEGVANAAELGGDDSGISPGTIPVSELSGSDAKPPGEGTVGNNKAH
jgi:LPXTG-motif cell wall-anchored protein